MKIKITNSEPKLISFWEIYGKELEVKDTKTAHFASGPKKYYVVEFDGRDYEVPEDLIESSNDIAAKGKKIDLGIAKKGEFAWDGENYYSGWYYESQDWNGWKVPYFEENVARDIMEKIRNEGETAVGKIYGGSFKDSGWWYSDFDTAPADRTVVMGQKIKTEEGDKEVWSIGGFEWTWGLKETAAKGAKTEKMEIKNQYEGLSGEQVWNAWTPSQRAHFMSDHFSSEVKLEKLKDWAKFVKEVSGMNWNLMPFKSELANHVKRGQYALGGISPSGKYRYLKIGNILKDLDGLRFKIVGYGPDGLKVKRYSEVEKNMPEITMPYSEIQNLADAGKLKFEGFLLQSMAHSRLLEMEIADIQKTLAWEDSRKVYQAELEQAADTIDKLKAELRQVKKEANAIMEGLEKNKKGFEETLGAVEALAKKKKVLTFDGITEEEIDENYGKTARNVRENAYFKRLHKALLHFEKTPGSKFYVGGEKIAKKPNAPKTKDLPSEVDELLTRKPADWDEIAEIPATVVQKHIKFFNALPVSNIKVEHPLNDFTDYTEPFILDRNSKFYIIVPEGSNYARYAGDITGAWTPIKAAKGIIVGDTVGNTVDGFNFEVLEIKGDKIVVKNKKTGSKKETHIDNMYKSKAATGKVVKDGVYLSKERGKFVLIATDTKEKWANEYFKDKQEALDFAKQNKLEVVESYDAKLEAFLKKFPDNAKSWAQATDEMRDLARATREEYNETVLNVTEGEKGYVESIDFRAIKTPAEWNKKAKAQIRKLWSKMKESNKENIIRKYEHWFN